MTENQRPSFPPLFSGLAISGQINPFEKARAEATRGCDAGLVVYNLAANSLEAAIVFAPDVTLEEAMAVLPLCGIGFQTPWALWRHLRWQFSSSGPAVCGSMEPAAALYGLQRLPWIPMRCPIG